MKVMIIGGGGREHALAWKIARSARVSDMLFVPGNGGMAGLGECVPADLGDPASLADIAASRGVDLTVVGPEAPLVAGVVDRFTERGLRIFGPAAAAASIEGSKLFAKRIMEKYGVPTGRSRSFTSFEEARAYVEKAGAPLVVKADGLAAGKGVTVAGDSREAVEALEDAMVKKVFGPAGDTVLVEEYLQGPEVSILSLTDGSSVVHMEPSQDHKRAFDGDRGPNTGGMGAYSPVPLLDQDTEETAHRRVMEAVISAMAEEGTPYKGVLYGGLILTDEGVKVLEFNVRFGDPEAQAVLPRLESDLLEGLLASVEGTMDRVEMKWSPLTCVCVVLASGGYPGSYRTGFPVRGLKAAMSEPAVEVFHAGTRLEDGKTVTAGGRVLNVVALGKDLAEARGLAYEAVERIEFEGMHYRKDIGHQAVS